MNDTELTRLAAKAFGDAPDAFSPLTDDGDALRLAVRLRITPRIHLQGYSNAVTAQSIVDSYTEMCGDDEMAATRRAIVRAAAEIGKDMP